MSTGKTNAKANCLAIRIPVVILLLHPKALTSGLMLQSQLQLVAFAVAPLGSCWVSPSPRDHCGTKSGGWFSVHRRLRAAGAPAGLSCESALHPVPSNHLFSLLLGLILGHGQIGGGYHRQRDDTIPVWIASGTSPSPPTWTWPMPWNPSWNTGTCGSNWKTPPWKPGIRRTTAYCTANVSLGSLDIKRPEAIPQCYQTTNACGVGLTHKARTTPRST